MTKEELIAQAVKIMKDIVANTTDPIEDKEDRSRVSCGYCGRDITGDEGPCPPDDCIGTQIKNWLLIATRRPDPNE